jgi:hypothetical protein
MILFSFGFTNLQICHFGTVKFVVNGEFASPLARLWLACWTQEEIAEEVGISKMEVSRVCNEAANLPESYNPPQITSPTSTRRSTMSGSNKRRCQEHNTPAMRKCAVG